ncbi:MAG: hypothetical protein QF714_08730 [Dehalococcoidia bacterium]|jgi:hypothetical protein|nr:hypothetical protein [Dehalococcoidia bacterium]MDP6227768.1 hypothetical protein [Dehalococcoidia bacterium]MDP7083751.1 hypothetical protein [Dehalococcoidia bacterium]MDP7202046.1 hypothetical protein [Dehalococcoidia bacterium]MDP7511214.1 hypothetical protein [Dehalococcoidia bacterium]
MFWFRQCPRCSGDIYVDRDQYGPYITCIQCGFSRDVPNVSEGPTVISAEPVPVPVVPREEGGRRRRISHGGRHFAKTLEFDPEPDLEIAA